MKKNLLYILAAILLAGCYGENHSQLEPEPAENETVVFTADELKLLSSLGESAKYGDEDISMDYGPKESAASSKDAISHLSNLKFTVTSKQDYGKSGVMNSLENSRPVYMSGYSHKSTFLGIPSYKNGHAWLIDGYLKQQHTTTITNVYLKGFEYKPVTRAIENPVRLYPWVLYPDRYVVCTTSYSYVREFFHNNFGWSGTDNGYYSCGLFDASNDPDLPSDTRSDEDFNYRHKLTMWTDIRR